MKYFTFGMKTMRMTQSYNEGNHLPHWKNSKNYSDYPIDVAGKDTGRDTYYATVDMQVVSIKGHAQKYTDMIWLVATENCITPLGNNIKPFIGLCHWNTDDPYITKLKVGDILKAGNPICMEGTDGAKGNHLHLICGDANRGCGDRLIENSNGYWVSTGYCYRPDQIMYIDTNFTNIVDTRDVNFQKVAITNKYTKGDSGDDITKIDDFLANQVKGNYYGDYTEACVSVYKKKKGISNTDGSFIDDETLEKMKQDGLQL